MQSNRFWKWMLGAVGAIAIAVATAWTQHWFGPPTGSTDRAMVGGQAGKTMTAEDLVGKWVYPDGEYWVIRPAASGKYSIEYYTADAEQVGEGDGQVVDQSFDFTLRAANHLTRGVIVVVPKQLFGRLRLKGGQLTGPTDDIGWEVIETGDPSKVSILTLARQ